MNTPPAIRLLGALAAIAFCAIAQGGPDSSGPSLHIGDPAPLMAPKSLTVIAVDADGLLGFTGSVEKVREFMKKHGRDMRYTVAMEDLANKTMSNAWITASGSIGAPVAFIIDRHGKLAWVGYPDMIQSYPFDQALDDTLAEKTDFSRSRELQAATTRETFKLIEGGQAS